MISTARLRLEPLRTSHAEAMFEGLNNERLYEFNANRTSASVDVLRERFALWEKGTSPDGNETWLNWVVFIQGSDQPIGFVQATLRKESPVNIAYALFVPAWGHGYAREATRAMIDHIRESDHTLCFRATTDPRNSRSIALLEALDFERYAVHKGTEVIRGEICDDIEFRLGIE